MTGIYDENPLKELYLKINNAFINSNKLDYGIDTLLRLILENNGCAFADNENKINSYKELIMNGTYTLYFIAGAKGNNINECFDFVEFNGMKYLIIFLDYFKDMKENTHEFSNSIDKEAAEFMGKSIYFNRIVKIVQIFIATISNQAIFTPTLSTSAAANIFRYAPDIIAGKIVNNICGELNENDIDGIDYKTLTRFISNEYFDLTLYGVYVL